ncbi:MAG TPA: DUF4166 domain-containing protein [Patescibacteria group bacterium]|nr:DUF4166 domain-containing protein [Patescibacteria group bacterium]
MSNITGRMIAFLFLTLYPQPMSKYQPFAVGELQPLFARILGPAWERLAPQLREMHNVTHMLEAGGGARIIRGSSPLARFGCWLMGFPPAGEDVPVRVHFAVREGVETWTRNFGGHRFRSRQYFASASPPAVTERFGPLRFTMTLTPDGDRLVLGLRGWSMFRVPLPLALAVRMEAYETVEDGKFLFNVRVWHPLAGPIIHYRGWLVPELH